MGFRKTQLTFAIVVQLHAREVMDPPRAPDDAQARQTVHRACASLTTPLRQETPNAQHYALFAHQPSTETKSVRPPTQNAAPHIASCTVKPCSAFVAPLCSTIGFGSLLK